jgi:hypothetical protein
MKKFYPHGDKSTKAKSSIDGHMYNPLTGTIDTFINGKFSHHLCQVHEPKPALAHKTFVVGTAGKIALNYASGPTEWKTYGPVVWGVKRK